MQLLDDDWVGTCGWYSFLFVLWYLSGTYWHTVQPDGWVAMFMTLGMTPLLLAKSSLSRWLYIVTGGLIGLVALYKQLYALFLLVPMLVLWVNYQAGSDRGYIHKPSGHLVSGILLVFAFVLPITLVVWWLASQMTMEVLFDAVVRYPAEVYVGLAVGGVGARLWRLVEYLLGVPLLLVLSPAILYGARAAWREDRIFALVVIFWLGLALAAILIQGRYFNYH